MGYPGATTRRAVLFSTYPHLHPEISLPSHPCCTLWEAEPWTSLSAGRRKEVDISPQLLPYFRSPSFAKGCLPPRWQLLPRWLFLHGPNPLWALLLLFSPLDPAAISGGCNPGLLVSGCLVHLVCSQNAVHACMSPHRHSLFTRTIWHEFFSHQDYPSPDRITIREPLKGRLCQICPNP